ncbi:MFS transporter [Streptomyces zhihengii]|uniref:MFS transporter n=1 Tax=Streptomyces zhihengii TaxID=1818004 RepID=UPI00368A6CD2
MSGRLHRGVALTGSVAGAAVVALDGTVLTVVQPVLQRDLGAGFAQVQWASTGYLIAVASLLVLAGRLGDRHGHEKLFAIGILGFGAASAGIAVAPGIGWIVGLRVVQGVFGALLQPATLGMLRASFPPDRLAVPIALRTSAIGLAAAAGPLAGGVLATHFGWRAVFVLNVVPATVLGVLALAVRPPAAPAGPSPAAVPGGTAAAGHGGPGSAVPVFRARRARSGPAPVRRRSGFRLPARTGAPESGARPAGAPAPGRLDPGGALLLAVALVCCVHTLVAVPRDGVTWATAAGSALTVLAGAAFVRQERRASHPLVPPAVIGSRPVAAALAVLVCASASMLGALFVAMYVLQDVLGQDPLSGSLTALPGAAAMILAAPLAPVLLRRQGARRTGVAASLALAAGVALLSGLGPATPWWHGGTGFVLLGAGFGTVMVAATAVAVREAPPEHAGLAGGLQQTAMNIGPTAGIAAATAVTAASPGVAAGTGRALLLLAFLAALGALPALRLPASRTPARTPAPSPDTPPGPAPARPAPPPGA